MRGVYLRELVYRRTGTGRDVGSVTSYLRRGHLPGARAMMEPALRQHPGGSHDESMASVLQGSRVKEPAMTRRTASTRSVDGALPQLAQPAIQGGRHAAAQIRRLLAGEPTEPVAYKDKGTMANLSVRHLAWPGRLNVIVGDPP
jgi:hypothetical protein